MVKNHNQGFSEVLYVMYPAQCLVLSEPSVDAIFCHLSLVDLIHNLSQCTFTFTCDIERQYN